MAFSDILNVLFERAKHKHGLKSQDEFADRHDVSRPTMNLYLNGKVPPAKTIARILKTEDYELADCIFLPDVEKSLHRKHLAITAQLHEILEHGGPQVNIVKIAIDAWYAALRDWDPPSMSPGKPRQ